MNTHPPSLADVQQNYGRLYATLENMQKAIARSEPCDLFGLDSQIATLCDDVLALPKNDRAGMEPRLKQMIELLDKLERDLRQMQQRSLGPTASAAYASTTKVQ
ncbi:MAG: hypothetical protein EBZ69_05120 [Alphaproteobacteria bacterium]|nr:hypothetical protein [Alphaproteobacteria bacterium]NDC56176.1 hypothetical protein [Alphaproteobacteria bacterium]NDG04523.1 hypothetical protein [Alphaproteobacteria bacterium]